MSGGILRYTKFSCPHCQVVFSNESIAVAHHSGKCPYCKEPIRIDATTALPRTLDTTLNSFVVLTLYAIVVWGIVEVTGFDIQFFIRESKGLVLVLVLLPGIALVHWYDAYEQRKLLQRASEQVKDGDV